MTTKTGRRPRSAAPLIQAGRITPTFYTGTHQVNWIADSMVPLFVSHRRLKDRKSLPVARSSWALDSGGFSELSLYGGWRTTAHEYIAAVRRYDIEIGNLDFAAPQDFMCEPDMLARTGLTVSDHQELTVQNFQLLTRLWADNPNPEREESPVVPVLQGQTLGDYLRCWDMYGDAGIDLADYPIIGVGSVCRRQHTDEIHDIVLGLLDRDPGLPLHMFGCKTAGLAKYGQLISSSDSLSWSFSARRDDPMPGCTHKSCSNCREYAMRWRRRIVGAAPCDGGHGVECDGGNWCYQHQLWERRTRQDASEMALF